MSDLLNKAQKQFEEDLERNTKIVLNRWRNVFKRFKRKKKSVWK